MRRNGVTEYVVSCRKHKLVQGSYVILKKIQYIPGWIELNFHDISDAYTYQTSVEINTLSSIYFGGFGGTFSSY